MAIIESGKTKSGDRLRLVTAKKGARVIIECTNYSAGRNVKTWRLIRLTTKMSHFDFQAYSKEGASLEVAKAKFDKRNAG